MGNTPSAFEGQTISFRRPLPPGLTGTYGEAVGKDAKGNWIFTKKSNQVNIPSGITYLTINNQTMGGDPAPTIGKVFQFVSTLDPKYLDPKYQYMGAFADKPQRALRYQLNNVSRVDDCYSQAKAKGYNTFGLQNGGQCFADNNPNFAQYGAVQSSVPLGEPWVNQVYVMTNGIELLSDESIVPNDEMFYYVLVAIIILIALYFYYKK